MASGKVSVLIKGATTKTYPASNLYPGSSTYPR